MSETQNSSKYDEHAEGLARFIREIANEEIDKALARRDAVNRAIEQDIRDRRAAARAQGGEPENEPAAEHAADQPPYLRRAASRSSCISSGTESILEASADSASQIFSVSFPSVTDARICASVVFASTSSPYVAESGAATPDAPAMTVSENTSAGAVSPSVPAHPRFVAIGQYVYDRELNRSTIANHAPAYLAELLNNRSFEPTIHEWEDAK